MTTPDIPPDASDGEGDTCDAKPVAALVPGMAPLSAGLPPYDEDARVLVYTEHDDFGGVQFHQIKVLDLYLSKHEDQTADEVADAATHWMPLPLPGRAQPEARLITRYAAIDDVPLARECAGAAAAVRRDTDRRDIADLLERAAIALTRQPAPPQPGTVTVQEYEGNQHWPKEDR